MRTSTFVALVVAASSLAGSARAFTLDLSGIDTNPSRVDGTSHASATIEYLGIGTDGHSDALSIWQDQLSSYGVTGVTVVAATAPLPGTLYAFGFHIEDFGFVGGLQTYGLGWVLWGDDDFLDALEGLASEPSTLEYGWNMARRLQIGGLPDDIGVIYHGDPLSGSPLPYSFFLAATNGFVTGSAPTSVGYAGFVPVDFVDTEYLVFGRMEGIPDETDPNVTNWQITLYDGVKMTLDAHVEGAPVPEPATTLALGAGALVAVIRRRRSR